MLLMPADTNLTGTIPADLGQVLVDLQMVTVQENPGALSHEHEHCQEGKRMSVHPYCAQEICPVSHGSCVSLQICCLT